MGRPHPCLPAGRAGAPPADSPRAACVAKVSAFLFLQHGTAKFFAIPHVAQFDNLRVWSLSGVAGVIEIVGGVLLLLGLFTRPVAFILSGEMAFAYFIAHASKGPMFIPILNRGELAALYCFVFIFISVAGPGVWSLDAKLRGLRK